MENLANGQVQQPNGYVLLCRIKKIRGNAGKKAMWPEA
jgi:hypothetical protein